jgi:hypothetical protein
MREEPIRAWRIWRVSDDSVLESPIYGDRWMPGQAFTADCPNHLQPAVACGCGVYAVTTRERALEWAEWARASLPYRVVLGTVQLWGRVLPHLAGYRAERAYPYALELLEDEPELEHSLRTRYLVDVVGPAETTSGPDHMRPAD